MIANKTTVGDRPPLVEARWYRFFHVGVIASMPFAEVAINRTLFVTPAGNGSIDSWLYTGCFLSLPDYLHRYHDTYYLTRLSWLLPGFIVHRLFAPLTANDVLHFTFFYALLAATYCLVSTGINRSAAILVTLIVGWNPAILLSLSWDYVDGAGIVFLVVTLLCLEHAARPKGHTSMWAAGAGASFACMVCANLFLVTLAPALALFLLLRTGSSRWRDVLRRLLPTAAGTVAVLVFFGGANRWLGGAWLFLVPSFRSARELLSGPNPWKAPGYGWIFRSTWLVLPAMASVGAVLALRCWRGIGSFERALQLTLLSALAWWIVLQLGPMNPFQIPYYVSYVSALSLLALPLQALTINRGVSPRVAVLLELGTFTFFAFAHGTIFAPGNTFWTTAYAWLNRSIGVVHPVESPMGASFATISASCVGLAAVLSLRSSARFSTRWVLFVAGLTVASAAMWPFWPRPVWSPAAAIDARAEFEEVVFTHRFIDRNIVGRPVRFWYDLPSDSTAPFRAISSTYLWQYALLNEQMPNLTKQEAALLKSDTRLVLLVPTVERAEIARPVLRTFGFDFSIVTHRQFGKNDFPFVVVIADVHVIGSLKRE